MSSMLVRHLPNGWIFDLSKEEYATPDGSTYGHFSIRPDIFPEAVLLPLSEREAGVDSWLELALLLASSS